MLTYRDTELFQNVKHCYNKLKPVRTILHVYDLAPGIIRLRAEVYFGTCALKLGTTNNCLSVLVFLFVWILIKLVI
jgi:hypothetical protein